MYRHYTRPERGKKLADKHHELSETGALCQCGMSQWLGENTRNEWFHGGRDNNPPTQQGHRTLTQDINIGH